MLHVIWRGSISFGLVNVPVHLHSAEAREDLDFMLLDKKDHSPIGYRKVSKATGEEVPRERIVRGYKLDSGNFVLVTDDDLRKASPERTKRIDIRAFVKREEIEPRFFERPYYLEPQPKNEKSYALLREAMARRGRVGIASVVLGTREALAAVMPLGKLLLLNVLRYVHELRPWDELHLPGKDLKALHITPAELEMAGKLIDGMTETFDPTEYKDSYHDDVLAFIRRKAKAGGVDAPEPGKPEREVKEPKVHDLMALLKKSLKEPAKKRKRA